MRRLLFAARYWCLDDSNGAAIANREAARGLSRSGFLVETLSGAVVDAGGGGDPAALLGERGISYRVAGGESLSIGPSGVFSPDPPRLHAVIDGVPTTVHRRPLRSFSEPDPAEGAEFLRLFDMTCDRLRPDVLVTYGGDALTRAILHRAARRGIATAFTLHNLLYADRSPFVDVDEVLVPSLYAAEHYRRTLGLRCTVLPNLVDPDRVRAVDPDPRFATFVNPCAEKGVYPFARIADELGRRRPDIPLLVVESRGREADLLACGLDLRRHRTVHVMPMTADPRAFWGATRVCLMPSLWRENQPLVAVEAMINGVPVLGSDRGGLPETLGAAGLVLPLPAHLTPETRIVPTPEEVGPWVDAVIRLWDDPEDYGRHRDRALREAQRWDPAMLAERYARHFADLRPRGG